LFWEIYKIKKLNLETYIVKGFETLLIFLGLAGL